MPKGHIETGSLKASIATIAREAMVCIAMMLYDSVIHRRKQ